ncbi:unnamed protein product [Durusdinium trenchii]|uniref:Uncharacterized protein n=1 Tax=Durusdinium trenchii TaxID=1381693 RepID=A0ABP0NKJ3_9DINO
MGTQLRSFRSLLRLCRECDQQPARLLGLLGRPPRQYDWNFNRAVRTRFSGSPFAEDMVWEARRLEPKDVSKERRHFRRAQALGMGELYPAEASELFKRIAASKSLVSQGDLLLTHPIACLKNTHFDQAVILLHEVSSSPSNPDAQVKGLVVNKPMPNIPLKQLLARATSPEDKEWAGMVQSDCKLDGLSVFRGGPIIVGNSIRHNLHWLHGFFEVPGAKQVAPGLWLGGDCREILEKGMQGDEVQSHSIPLRVCFGYSAWTELQLRLELESGVWTRAQALDDRPRDGALSIIASSCFGTEGKTAWQQGLHSAGWSFMANFPRNAEVDEKLERHTKQQESQAQLQAQTPKP